MPHSFAIEIKNEEGVPIKQISGVNCLAAGTVASLPVCNHGNQNKIESVPLSKTLRGLFAWQIGLSQACQSCNIRNENCKIIPLNENF